VTVPAPAVHEHRLRVRYAETDAMGVAHHASYAVWLEEARIRALDGLGHAYRQLEADGVLMPVVELHISYRRPLRFDDELRLATRIIVAGPSRVRFECEVHGPAGLHATAVVEVATVGRDGRPARLPASLRSALEPAPAA
jgi:acyl-CoA thioester hydrolase